MPSRLTPEDRFLALRELQHASSIAIDLLAALDRARAQVSVLEADKGGEMIDCPPGCLALDVACRNALQRCREIKPVKKTQN